MVGIGGTGLHGRHAVLAVLQDVVGDVVVHIVEAPLALEERVGEVLVFRPVLVPEVCDGHPEVAGAGEAVLRVGVEVPHGVAVEGRREAHPGLVDVRAFEQRPFQQAASRAGLEEVGGEVVLVFVDGVFLGGHGGWVLRVRR